MSNIVYGTEGQQFWTGSSHTMTRLGTQMHFQDGREFVFVQAGGTTLAPGKVMSSAAVTSNNLKDMAVATTAAIGDITLDITNGATAITANMYNEGYMFVNNETGEGYIYKIKSHEVDASGNADIIFTFEEGSALRTILTAGTSLVGLKKHPCDDIVVAPTTEVGVPVGVTVGAITTLLYGWVQTKGYACVLTDGSVLLGMAVMTSGAEGAVTPYLPAGDDIPIIGHVVSVAAATEYSLIDLCIS